MNEKHFSDISLDNAERLQELFNTINDSLEEFKGICRNNMSRSEYEQFTYRTLGHIEPAVRIDSPWVTRYSSLDPLEKVAENALSNANENEETDEDGDYGEDEEDI